LQDLGKAPDMPVLPASPRRPASARTLHSPGYGRAHAKSRNWNSMSYIDEKKVNAAVRVCLERCRGASHSLAKLAGYLAELRVAGAWREAEIHAVERSVIKMLNGIAQTSIYAADATNRPLAEARLDDCGSTRVSGA